MRVIIALIALSALVVSNVTQARAGERNPEHPFIEQKDIKSETCLTCHPEKKGGKFVHTAVGMGCENCHQAASDKGKTTITPIATGGDLCAMCHEASKDPVQHGPYKSGQCLMCHDPHSSDFKAQTREEVNKLCLSCHADLAATSDPVKLFDDQKISRADYDAIPKIDLDRTQRIGHPWVTHPVAVLPDPLRGGQKMSCLSCHAQHASAVDSLIVAAKGGKNVCDACHNALDERAAAKNKSQSPSQAPSQPPQKPGAATQSEEKDKP